MANLAGAHYESEYEQFPHSFPVRPAGSLDQFGGLLKLLGHAPFFTSSARFPPLLLLLLLCARV